jgi:hypothetical protein
MAENNFAHRRAHGNFEYAGLLHMSADADKFESARAIDAGGFEPLDPARDNLRHVGKSFDIVDYRGLLPKSQLTGEWRLVARFRAMTLDCFDQGTLFSANVSTRTDKHFEIEIKIAAENFAANQTCLRTSAQFLAKNFFLKWIFVADVEDATFCAGDEPRNDHSFSDKVWQVAENEAILDRAGLALVGIANDVLHWLNLLTNEIPLYRSWKSRATHAAQFRFFQSGEHTVPIACGNEVPQYGIFFAASIRIGRTGYTCLVDLRSVECFAANRSAPQLFGLFGGDFSKNFVVDSDSWRLIASAEAADIFDLHIYGICRRKSSDQIGAQFAGTIQMTAHIGADVNFSFGRKGQMKMRIKAGDAVELIERSLRALRKGLQLCDWQIPEAQLDGSQFVEDHDGMSRETAPCRNPSPGAVSRPRYFRTNGGELLWLIRDRCLFAQWRAKADAFWLTCCAIGRYKQTELSASYRMTNQYNRYSSRTALCLAAMFLCLLSNQSFATDAPEPIKYIGPGSCAATSCHGSVKPVAGSRILQNEYSTWILQDKHSRAYQALTGEAGEGMAKILKLGGKPEQSQKCLACHALSVLAAQRGRSFEISEGVSCENCHGPASAWLGPHTTLDWPHEKSVAQGMTDTRNVIHRTDKCLECHLGTRERFVDHEMIAAGHPDLYFELDSFSAVMPRHWRVPRESTPGKPVAEAAWSGVRDWGTGQAVQLRASMERLAWRAKGERGDKKDPWPEYAELSCFACHHSLGPAKDNWRREHGYEGRRPGDPAWNSSRYAVFRIFAKQVDSALAQELERNMMMVAAEMSKLNPDRSAVANAALSAAPLAQQIAERLATMKYDQAITLRMLEGISDNAEEIAISDERAAEQAAMALDSLYIAYSKDTKPADAAEARASINELFQQLENPSSYNADRFASSLRRLRPLLH